VIAFFDMSAHARGGGHYTSHSHVSGWEVLGFILFIFLAAVLYQVAKLSLTTSGLFTNIAVFAAIAGILVACLFIGPIGVVIGIGVCLYLAYHAHNWWTERSNSALEER